jgi:polyisoprenoid-binding protein YceI
LRAVVHRGDIGPGIRLAMKKLILASLAILLSVAPVAIRRAVGDTWNLPSPLNDSNTKVSFVVDSTWHTVKGTTKDLSGSVLLKDKNDPLSIVVDLKIQVKTFDTDWDSRDEKLQECMASDTYPLASFTSTRLSENCKPTVLDIAGKCSGTLTGIITMRDVSKEVALPVSITKGQDSYLISGALPVTWADYNIEDPSILIAKLDPVVTISYETKVPLKR